MRHVLLFARISFVCRQPCGSCVPRVPCASLFVLHLLLVFYFLFLLLGLCILDFTLQCGHQLFVFTCLPLHVLCLDPF